MKPQPYIPTSFRASRTFPSFICTLVMMASLTVYGQVGDCAAQEDENEPAPLARSGGGGIWPYVGCNNLDQYAPDVSNNFQNTPNIVFRVNYHFVRPTNATGPYAGVQVSAVNTEVAGLNSIYGSLLEPVLPVEPPADYIPDSRIRFVLNGIYYHNNDTYYMTPSVYCGDFTLINTYGVDVDNTINIFYLTTEADPPFGCATTTIDISTGLYKSFIYMNNGAPSATPRLLAHELGHALGIHHTFGSCCSNDNVSDTYHPDCNTGEYDCGPDELWQEGCEFGNSQGISNNIMGYNRCRTYFSPLQLSMMHWQATQRVAGPYGAGRRNYISCEVNEYNPTIQITQDAVWDKAKVVNADIVIETGTTLDIRCTVFMSPHAKIIVKPGAKLIVDGGKITARSRKCHTFWKGIQAWGAYNQHQYPSHQPAYQGLVVLKNNAVIEHAEVGFANYGSIPFGFAKFFGTGGAIQVQGTGDDLGVGGTFLNCKNSVEFRRYKNFIPGTPTTEANNISYFRHARFEIDDNYRGNDDFRAHVRMNSVKGIFFTRCDFVNTQTSTAIEPKESHTLGAGIWSLNAGYSVTGWCIGQLPIPCEYGSGQPEPGCSGVLKRSTFIGLDHGIRAGASGIGNYTFSVRDSYFDANVCGIFNEGVNHATILRNEFRVGGRHAELTDNDVFFNGRHRAVYITHGNGFRVEENDFIPAPNPTAQTEGVVIGNSGAYNDQVYLNTSDGMDYGFVAEDNCVDMNDAAGTGLSFLCNENVLNNEQDFTVRPTLSLPIGGPHNRGIKMHQGSYSLSAGNIFSATGVGNFNFFNEAQDLTITYFPQQVPGKLNPGSYNDIWVYQFQPDRPQHNCPTRIICGGGSTQVKSTIFGLMEQEQLAYLNLKYVYESLLDGGDFDELKETIMESWPQDAWELRNELMTKSPFLSTEILIEVGKKNVLPHAMYLEVCLANSEATQRESFIKWVQYDAPDPLPEYMVGQIMASWNQKTWRTSLEADMVWHKAEYQRLNDQIVGSMLNDTVVQPVDSIRAHLQINSGLRARFSEVGALLGQNQFDIAIALLAGLDGGYHIEKQGKRDRDDVLHLIAVLRPFIADGQNTVLDLDSVGIAALVDIAHRQPSLGASYARSILCYGYDICEPVLTGESPQHKRSIAAFRGITGTVQPVLRVHPNPASTWLAFSHQLDNKVERAFIRVRDVVGKTVHEAEVGFSPGQLVWDSRGIVNGVYIVELHSAGRLVDAQRVVIQQ